MRGVFVGLERGQGRLLAFGKGVYDPLAGVSTATLVQNASWDEIFYDHSHIVMGALFKSHLRQLDAVLTERWIEGG